MTAIPIEPNCTGLKNVFVDGELAILAFTTGTVKIDKSLLEMILAEMNSSTP